MESVDRRMFKIYFICILKKGPTDSVTAGFETGGPTTSCLSLGDPASSLNLSCLLCTMGCCTLGMELLVEVPELRLPNHALSRLESRDRDGGRGSSYKRFGESLKEYSPKMEGGWWCLSPRGRISAPQPVLCLFFLLICIFQIFHHVSEFVVL